MSDAGLSLRSRIFRGLCKVFIVLAIILFVGMIIGQSVRDRFVITSLMMFIPPMPASCCIVIASFLGGWRRKIKLGCLFTLIFSIVPMIGQQSRSTIPKDATPLRIIHWNVLWGGLHKSTSWQVMQNQLRDAAPDMILLSEAPTSSQVNTLLQTLGSQWTAQEIQHAPRERYTFHLVIASRYNVIVEDIIKTSDARMLCARVEAPTGPVRVLMVDGLSSPLLLRTPRLLAVKRYVEERAAGGENIDIIAGDFNSPATCIGFDAFATMAGGFVRASDYSHEWRGTWPNVLPLWDIDHVFISKRWGVVGADVFSSTHSDHRGQLIEIIPAQVKKNPRVTKKANESSGNNANEFIMATEAQRTQRRNRKR